MSSRFVGKLCNVETVQRYNIVVNITFIQKFFKKKIRICKGIQSFSRETALGAM